MQHERTRPLVGTGTLELTPREGQAVQTLVEALHDALRRRLPVSLSLVDFDLHVELARYEPAVVVELAQSQADTDSPAAMKERQ